MCRNTFYLSRVFEVSQEEKLTNGCLTLSITANQIAENYLSYEYLEVLFGINFDLVLIQYAVYRLISHFTKQFGKVFPRIHPHRILFNL